MIGATSVVFIFSICRGARYDGEKGPLSKARSMSRGYLDLRAIGIIVNAKNALQRWLALIAIIPGDHHSIASSHTG